MNMSYNPDPAIENLTNQVSKIAEEAEKSSKQSRCIAVISIIIATMSMFAALCFSFLDYQGDKKWQNEQINELKQANEHLTKLILNTTKNLTPSEKKK